jgi:hypothetical protein
VAIEKDAANHIQKRSIRLRGYAAQRIRLLVALHLLGRAGDTTQFSATAGAASAPIKPNACNAAPGTSPERFTI